MIEIVGMYERLMDRIKCEESTECRLAALRAISVLVFRHEQVMELASTIDESSQSERQVLILMLERVSQ